MYKWSVCHLHLSGVLDIRDNWARPQVHHVLQNDDIHSRKFLLSEASKYSWIRWKTSWLVVQCLESYEVHLGGMAARGQEVRSSLDRLFYCAVPNAATPEREYVRIFWLRRCHFPRWDLWRTRIKYHHTQKRTLLRLWVWITRCNNWPIIGYNARQYSYNHKTDFPWSYLLVGAVLGCCYGSYFNRAWDVRYSPPIRFSMNGKSLL